jgi:DNA-binding MarR family transcriptional regulator
MSKLHRSFPLDQSTYYLIIRTSMHLKTALYRALHSSGLGITPEQWSVLCCLWEEDGLNHAEIARRTCRDKFTITRIINLLEKKGLVHRMPDPRDRRRSNLHLTREGADLKEPLTQTVEEFSQKAFDGLSENDVEHLRRIQNKILHNLESRDFSH